MPQDPLLAVRESERKRYLADLEDKKVQEQRKKEEAKKEAEEQRERERLLEWDRNRSKEQKDIQDFIFKSKIEGEKRRAFYKLTNWNTVLEKRIKTLEEKLDAKIKELENRIESL